MPSGIEPNSPSVVVAIDGPAGSGKSTLARLLADRLGFRFLDSGAMYRALTLKVLRRGSDPSDEAAATALLDGTEIRLVESDRGQRTLLDGEDVSEAIRSEDVTRAVSAVAALPGVRGGMVQRQRDFASEDGDGVVVEGRDIGTVVFPDAAVKVYLDADAEERARRRSLQTGEDVQTVRASQEERDARDSNREVAPLRAADDAETVDTTGLGIEEVLEALLAVVRRRTGSDGPGEA